MRLPRLPRRRQVPQAVRDVPLPSGDRRVAWALTPAGEPVVATGSGLVLADGRRLEWVQIAKAVWSPPRLTVLEVADVDGAGARTVLELVEDTELPAVVRSRVTASVAWSGHSQLSPSGGVRVVGRKRSGQDGLEWQLVYDEGTDREDPLVRAQAEQILQGARRSIG